MFPSEYSFRLCLGDDVKARMRHCVYDDIALFRGDDEMIHWFIAHRDLFHGVNLKVTSRWDDDLPPAFFAMESFPAITIRCDSIVPVRQKARIDLDSQLLAGCGELHLPSDHRTSEFTTSVDDIAHWLHREQRSPFGAAAELGSRHLVIGANVINDSLDKVVKTLIEVRSS